MEYTHFNTFAEFQSFNPNDIPKHHHCRADEQKLEILGQQQPENISKSTLKQQLKTKGYTKKSASRNVQKWLIYLLTETTLIKKTDKRIKMQNDIKADRNSFHIGSYVIENQISIGEDLETL